MRYESDINTAQLMEINMPRGSGSVDNAPDSQWIYAGSKLERRKYSFITLLTDVHDGANPKYIEIYICN